MNSEQVKPQTITDVQVLLAVDLNIDEKALRQVSFHKEKGKPNCIIRPKRRLPNMMWRTIHNRVKALGGQYSYGSWVVPLE
jgi:hypothetical protein